MKAPSLLQSAQEEPVRRKGRGRRLFVTRGRRHFVILCFCVAIIIRNNISTYNNSEKFLSAAKNDAFSIDDDALAEPGAVTSTDALTTAAVGDADTSAVHVVTEAVTAAAVVADAVTADTNAAVDAVTAADEDTEKDQLILDSTDSTKLPADAISIPSDNDRKENLGEEEKGGSAYLTMYGEHRVKSALTSLPKWLQEYFAWHRNQTQKSDIQRVESEATRYLVISCVANDGCGGFSDRLRPLPFYLLLASRLDRVLCIYWSRPFGADSFLQPLQSGMNWRCPADFEPLVDQEMSSQKQAKYKHYTLYSGLLSTVNETEKAITTISKNTDRFYSIGFKDQDFVHINESNMVFHAYSYNRIMPVANAWMHIPLTEHIFRAMFEPIEPIAKSINATMTRLGLVENEYTSVHVRARYPVPRLTQIIGDWQETVKHDIGQKELTFEGSYKDYLTNVGNNALECGILLNPDNKIFFSSDSIDLSRHFIGNPVKLGKDQIEYQPLGIDSREEIRHFEYEHKIDHVEFYPLIEDLLIMGGSQCVSHGVGGFGAFGAGLAGNRCRAIHRKPAGATEPCPNGRGASVVVNITDDYLIFGENASVREGRLPLAEKRAL